MTLHLAYGSNMDPKRIRQRIKRSPQPARACLKGFTLLFNKRAEGKVGIGWANIVKATNHDVVHGILYDLTEAELKTLDRFEKVEEGHYCRQDVVVQRPDGMMSTAVAYVACLGWVADGLLPTHDYLNHLLAGRDLLPADYVAALERQPVRETK